MANEPKTIVRENEKGKYTIHLELCKGCGLCAAKCPKKTLFWTKELGVYGTPAISPKEDQNECIACGTCQRVCPDCAIRIEKK